MNPCQCGLCAEHETHGAWLKSKGFQLMACAPTSTGNDRSANKKWERRLQSYRDERAAGNRPAQTTTAAIEHAKRASDATGKPYVAHGASIPGVA